MGPIVDFGLFAGVIYGVDRVLATISPRLGIRLYEMMVQPIDGKPILPSGLAKNLTFSEIGPNHPDLDLMPARSEIKESRFAQGSVCLGAYRRGELLGYAWFCFGVYQEDEVRCTYLLAEPETSVFDFDLYLLPEHRMGIGFAAIWHGANEFLYRQGIRYTFSRLTRFNLASRRAHARLGWRRLGHLLFFKAWNAEMMISTLSPYFAISLTNSSRPTLSLSPISDD